jgi:hypothetical protein
MLRPLGYGVASIVLLASGCVAVGEPVAPSQGLASHDRGGMVIRNQHHRTYTALRLSTKTGDCLEIVDSTEITIENAQIGPCGGNGIAVRGGDSIRIYDSYVHPETRASGCCDTNDGILVAQTREVTIRGNVVAYGESNVEAPQQVAGLTVVGNFLLNPRGPYPRGQNVQAWNSTSVSVRGNYTLSSGNAKRFLYPDDQEDSINFGEGTDFIAEGNYVTGGHSKSGCGLIADDAANHVRILSNSVVDSGQCGIGVASGTGQSVEANRVLNRTPVRGGGNTAIYVWNQYRGVKCGPVAISKNVATEIRKDGTQAGFWNGGGCDPVGLHRNVWNGAAQRRLTPVKVMMPAPPIPPLPEHCVARSPYSTQKKWPACNNK